MDSEMIRIMETKTSMTSCIALNYDLFRDYFDIDLERSELPEQPEHPEESKSIETENKTQDIPF